jgi:phosphate transport system permease protein
MRLGARKLLNHAFSGFGIFAVLLMAAALLVILAPVLVRGAQAFIFSATVEHRRLELDLFGRGDRAAVEADCAAARQARQPVMQMLEAFREELKGKPFAERRKYEEPLRELEDGLRQLLGPLPGEPRPALFRQQYGQTRWDRAQVKLADVLYKESYDYSDPTKMGRKVLTPREEDFQGTSLAALFPCLRSNVAQMLRPRLTFYWRFLTDESKDAHFFGGIWPELLGTFYLAVGAIVFAVPLGIIAAIYLTEYARQDRLNSILRTFISTLAGVPSIVFGLFGLAFFINALHVSPSKSVLAGSLTLALLILPTVIRAAEEAIRAVPHTYKEASLSLGAGKWQTVMSVILPAALPGILTGIVISMGRAAGETAPIIFTAAVSVGAPLALVETLSQPTPALSWNVYNLATEHQKVDELRHVQFGMVFALVAIVLLLNLTAIVLRARVSRKLRG